MNNPPSDTVISFLKGGDADSLDSAGRNVLGLLERAAGLAEENSQRAVAMAHKLSIQLRAAEDRLAELEGNLRYHKERAARAEKWLLQISQEIEERFFASDAPNSQQAPNRRRESSPLDFARKGSTAH